tara:strand:- start:4185 stop:5000 length:816 start_codon:yes stop_codon:yes gene_type:complete
VIILKLIKMKDSLNKNCVYFLVIFLFVLQGCTSKKKIVSETPVNDIEVSEIIKASKGNELNFKNIRNRIKVEYENGRINQSISLNFRALESEVLWISATMVVPIAKILMSNERLVFYEKFQKTYIDQEISQIMRIAGIKKPVKTIQNLLYGRPIIDINKAKWDRVENSRFYILKTSDQIQTTLFINPETYQLHQQRIFSPLLSSLITITYNNYRSFEDKFIPNNVLISWMRGDQIINIKLEYSQIDFPENLTFPMEIPADYKIKTLDEILN